MINFFLRKVLAEVVGGLRWWFNPASQQETHRDGVQLMIYKLYDHSRLYIEEVHQRGRADGNRLPEKRTWESIHP
jgi:hypothetical protein